MIEQNQGSDPLVGQVVDERYRIVALIAHGGMATVYVAMDQRLDRAVAFKIIHTHLAASGRFNARFQREARSAVSISHPGVVPVYDQGTFEGRPYLVMELIRGQNLRQVLRAAGPLPVGKSLDYARQILLAVGAAHSARVIHRDLKPENILIGDDNNVRVTDFGLAKATTDEMLTAPDSLMGTTAYLAPEASLPGQVDQRVDIYAAGLILFEMLCGVLPWRDSTPAQLTYAHLHEDVPAPSTVVPWLPESIDHLTLAMCARNRDDRLSSTVECVELIDACLLDLSPEVQSRSAEAPESQRASSEKADSSTTLLQLSPPHETAILPHPQQVVYTSGAVHNTPTGSVSTTRHRTVPVLVLIFALVVSGLCAGAWWWMHYGPGSYVEVPELAGTARANAEITLDQQGLTYISVDRFSDDVAEDTVIDTEPAAGSRIHKSDSLTLIVSKGVQTYTVPDILSMTVDEASQELADRTLTVGTQKSVWSDDVPEGEIVAVSPQPGMNVPHDSTVDLDVSKGPEPTDVPYVVGLDSDRASQVLSDSRLEPTLISEFSSEVPEGVIISQDPMPEDGPVAPHSQVTLVVSQGVETTQVPDVTGKDQEEAEQLLRDKGFDVEVHRELGFFARVVSQSPTAGEDAPVGSVVTLTVR